MATVLYYEIVDSVAKEVEIVSQEDNLCKHVKLAPRISPDCQCIYLGFVKDQGKKFYKSSREIVMGLYFRESLSNFFKIKEELNLTLEKSFKDFFDAINKKLWVFRTTYFIFQ